MSSNLSFQTLEIERHEDIVVVKTNRPDALNALNRQLLTDIRDAMTQLAQDDTISVVVVTGNGRSFVAGADIKEMVDYSAEEAADYQQLGADAFNAVAAIPCPVIAAVNGFALGGGLELALACDLIYASEKAKFGIPEVGLGVIPGWGGTQRLPRLISLHDARELLYTGKMIDAAHAKSIRLALEVFPLDKFLEEVMTIAKTIASKGPLALRAAKSVSARGYDATLKDSLKMEGDTFASLFATNDQKEGMRAFIEKRSADFTRS